MTAQVQTGKPEGWDRVTVLAFVLIGAAFVSYSTLVIVSMWVDLHFLVVISPLLASLLVCLITLVYLIRKTEKLRKVRLANDQRVRSSSVDLSAGLLLMSLESRGFSEIAWRIRRQAVDGDTSQKALVERTWNSLQNPILLWETNRVIQSFLKNLEGWMGRNFGESFAQGAIIALANERLGLGDPARVFMIQLLQLLYPNLAEWELLTAEAVQGR